MKKIILSLLLTASFFAGSQTFVDITPTFLGKSQEEIKKLNSSNNNKFLFSANNKVFGNDVINLNYSDGKYAVNYEFSFIKDKCVSFIILTSDESAKNAMVKDIEKKCREKLGDNSRLQKVDGLNCIWNLPANKGPFMISNTQSK